MKTKGPTIRELEKSVKGRGREAHIAGHEAQDVLDDLKDLKEREAKDNQAEKDWGIQGDIQEPVEDTPKQALEAVGLTKTYSLEEIKKMYPLPGTETGRMTATEARMREQELINEWYKKAITNTQVQATCIWPIRIHKSALAGVRPKTIIMDDIEEDESSS